MNKFKEFYNKVKGYFVSISNVAIAVWCPDASKVFVASIVNSVFAIVDAVINFYIKDNN